jgi:polyisoprenoid-binding protein YceI
MLRTILVSLLLSCVSTLCAAWDLQPDTSVLNFVSIKNNSVGELHQFKKLSGQIDSNGKAQLVIALDSVDTAIPIRDERMRQYLFETAKYATARYSATVMPAVLTKLAVGESTTLTLDGELTLHGKSMKVPARVAVLKTSAGQLRISTVEPILLNANQFGMTAGVAKLMELASLPSISSVVPVTFALTFAVPQILSSA